MNSVAMSPRVLLGIVKMVVICVFYVCCLAYTVRFLCLR
jgi:hypothetical protein